MNVCGLHDLAGKVIVITGGAGVLCSVIAEALGECGSKIVILDIDEEAMKILSKKLSKKKIKHITLKIDVLKKNELVSARDKILKKYKRVDVLINGAGGNHPRATTSPDISFFELPEDAVRKVFDLNFLSAFLASQVFGKVMAGQNEGIILNISSMSAFRPLTKISAYSAAKAALSNFTQWLAVHMSENYSKNIRVNAIAPGFFLTKQNRFLLIDEKTSELTQRGKSIIQHTPMKTFGKPEDLIGAVIFLLSPASKFVHGIILPIDGGFSAFSGV